MLGSYLKIALRLLARQRSFALITISGLTIGMVGFILIYLFVSYELGFNRHHHKIDRIYLIVRDVFLDNSVYNFTPTPYPFRDAILSEYPEIEHAVRLEEWTRLMFEYNKKKFEETVTMTDKEVFEVFTFNILEGDAADPLPGKNSVSSTPCQREI
jgi:putative ABC transport system permease protein